LCSWLTWTRWLSSSTSCSMRCAPGGRHCLVKEPLLLAWFCSGVRMHSMRCAPGDRHCLAEACVCTACLSSHIKGPVEVGTVPACLCCPHWLCFSTA
jgi:hypothetical protein